MVAKNSILVISMEQSLLVTTVNIPPSVTPDILSSVLLGSIDGKSVENEAEN